MVKMNVESFNLDHTKVAAPFVRLAGTKQGNHGDVVYKYDVSFNGGKHSQSLRPSGRLESNGLSNRFLFIRYQS